MISNKEFPTFTDSFFFTFSKIICFYIKLYKDDLKHIDNLKKLTEIINNYHLEGNNTNLIQYIQSLLLNDNIGNDAQKNKIDKIKSLKEKYKKKFEKQIQLAINKYSSLSDSNIEKEDDLSAQKEEICIYCRQPLNIDLNNYYGKICYFCRDYFIDILKNKEKNKRKKSTRFVICKHKIHFNCYFEFICFHSNNELEFECPLCKKLSNIIICDFNNLIQNNKKFLEGLILDNENIKDFYIENNNNYKEFFLFNINFFEKYCSKLLKKEIIIKDINTNKNIAEQVYDSIVNDFDTFMIYYNITNYKNEQIDIWKNILYTIRLLCKYKLINITDFLISKFLFIYKNIKSLELNSLFNFELSSILNELILCLFILYDLKEESKEKIKNLFQNYILL